MNGIARTIDGNVFVSAAGLLLAPWLAAVAWGAEDAEVDLPPFVPGLVAKYTAADGKSVVRRDDTLAA